MDGKHMSARRKLYVRLMKALMLLAAGLTGALVLFLFIMLINATLNFFLKRNKEGDK